MSLCGRGHENRCDMVTPMPSLLATTLFNLRRFLLAPMLAFVVASLTGCGAAGPPTFQIQAGGYDAAFNASRHVLRDFTFELERVDAAEGVITTRDKASAGAGTPWDGVQSTLEQELSDLTNLQKRRVRITFRPVGQDDGVPAADQACEGDVQVVIWRTQSPLVRPNSRSISLTTTAIDPALSAKQIYSSYDVAVERDEELENRIARAIESRLAPPPQALTPRPRQPLRGPREIATLNR